MGGAQSKSQYDPKTIKDKTYSFNSELSRSCSEVERSGSCSFSGEEGCPMKKNGNLLGNKNSYVVPKTKSMSDNSNASMENDLICPVIPIDNNITRNKYMKSQKVQYNVYSVPIDSKNNMPAVANQLPAPLQEGALSTERLHSTIPKGGAENESTWTYPSPQMFYNALVRKHKLGDTKESDVESIVALHNNMNEMTWSKVMEWENVLAQKHDDNCSPNKNVVKLLKFMGRPSDLSPKARFKNLVFGHPLPFDRHDWTVIRPDGNEVRYVIDYYFDESRASGKVNSGKPHMHDRDAVQSILVDVRPAIDSLKSAMGRVATMPYARLVGKTTSFDPLPLLLTKKYKKKNGKSLSSWNNNRLSSQENKVMNQDIPVKEETEIEISGNESIDILTSFASMMQECKDLQQVIDKCKDDDECMNASLALTMCMAKVICPLQHDVVTTILSSDQSDHKDDRSGTTYPDHVEAALKNVALCVQGKSERLATTKRIHIKSHDIDTE